MRFSFAAIDKNGQPLRGVLSAESEEQARELLLSEDVFPKQLEPAQEGTKVSWAPKKPLQERLRRSAASAGADPLKILRAQFQTRAVFGTEMGTGTAGLNEQDDFIFKPQASGSETVVLEKKSVETASIHGFPTRHLVITMLDARTYEFEAGLFLACGEAKEVVRTLKNP